MIGKFTLPDERRLAIRLKDISKVYEYNGYCAIYVKNGSYFLVQEDYDTVTDIWSSYFDEDEEYEY